MEKGKVWTVEEFHLDMDQMAESVTREYARTVMTDEEFACFCTKQDENLKRRAEAAEEYARTHYFPGCYGDPLVDC